MIRRSILVTIIAFCSLCTLNAQNQCCGTHVTPQEMQRYNEDIKRLKARGDQRIYEDNTIRVIMYRLRYDDGSMGRTDAEFAEEINNLNSFYDDYDICFTLMRIINVDNSEYLVQSLWDDDDSSDSLKSVVRSDNPSFSDALTIYVLPTDIWYRGSAYGIPSAAFIMTSSDAYFNGGDLRKWGSSHSAHEAGHCLGLIHTHESVGGFELVTRTWGELCFNAQGAWLDCNTGGDKLCDTEADFNLSGAPIDTATCVYVVDTSMRDCQNNVFDPDELNIMSYAPEVCTNEFSGGQEGKMHLTLDVDLIFNGKQSQQNYTFNGNNYTSGYKHVSAKNSITVANSGTFDVSGTAQVVHDAEFAITLHPGFQATATTSEGFYVARAKGLCNNSTEIDYSIID